MQHAGRPGNKLVRCETDIVITVQNLIISIATENRDGVYSSELICRGLV
jgi:hypothetical protein